jgi:hypothetical protein
MHKDLTNAWKNVLQLGHICKHQHAYVRAYHLLHFMTM